MGKLRFTEKCPDCGNWAPNGVENHACAQPPAPPGAEEAADLDHPCKRTCSGWQQGYERGHQRFVTDDDSRWKEKYERAQAEAKEREEKLRQLTNEASDLRAALQCYKDHMAQGAKLIGWVAP